VRSTFELATGTVVGTDHLRTGRNGHDAFASLLADDLAIALVCDGCGSGAHSEVGAKIGARILVRELAAGVRRGLDLSPDSPLWTGAAGDTIAQLKALASTLGGSPVDTVETFLLFTVVGLLITPRETAVFFLGDGVIVINGTGIVLGPFPDNAPPYLSYALLDGTTPRLNVNQLLSTNAIESLVVATDGATGIVDRLPAMLDDLAFRNPDVIRRRLFLLTRDEPGLLHDDTTIVAIRRRKNAAESVLS
jgi:hypothetical protein